MEVAPDNIQVNLIAQNYVDNPAYYPPELQANERFAASQQPSPHRPCPLRYQSAPRTAAVASAAHEHSTPTGDDRRHPDIPATTPIR